MSETVIKSKAVIYRRVSSTAQTTRGDGLGSQETRCREYARMRGYEIVQVFTDDMSGSAVDRPGVKAMLAFLKKHRSNPHVILVDDISRLARSVSAHIELRAAITLAGGRLESPTLEFNDDADSELQEYILATVAQHQRRKNAEQTKNRMRARVMNGYWVFQAPVGYRYEKSGGPRQGARPRRAARLHRARGARRLRLWPLPDTGRGETVPGDRIRSFRATGMARSAISASPSC